MSNEQLQCNCCRGGKLLEMKCYDLGGRDPYHPYRWFVVTCHVCDGKGYVTPEDNRRVHNILNDYRPLYSVTWL